MVVTRCGKSGVGLFIGLFFLTIFIGAIASNDVVILTLSPLICYLSLTLSIDPWPFLIAEFVAANTASMALYIGNPTNVVISMAYDISFLRYSKLLSLPFLGAVLVQLGLLVVVYWKSIPKSIQAIDASPRVALVRPRAALIGLLALLLCIFALVLSSLWHVSVWKVTLPFAILVAAIDLFEDVFVAIKSSQRANKGTEDDECFDLTVEKKTAPAHSFHTVPADDVERQTAPSFRSVPQPSKKAYSDFIAKSNVKPLEPNENSYGAFLTSLGHFALPFGNVYMR
ncbi:hypothetical protein L0F63_002752 [Massospora cicadina]|nr:hypothetical protein L0F63_002752 [Massospora cicadina]